MPSKMKLVLDNGMEFKGEGFGAHNAVAGDLVFNTEVVGYQELISDPSYAGQIVMMTYPVIGQYGIAPEDFEAKTLGAAALVVRECCDTPSNFRYTQTLSECMEERRIPGIQGLDTRMLTHIIRDCGPVRAAIVPEDMDPKEIKALLESREDDRELLCKASCTKRWFSRTPNHRFDVVILDCGVKHSIIKELNSNGCNVTVLPCNSCADEILSFHPDGILVSSGPGDAHNFQDIVAVLNSLKGKLPIVGIGLGFELLLLSYGEKLERLSCSEHGGAPVMEKSNGRIISVLHNRAYTAGEKFSAKASLDITHVNVCDNAIVGFECAKDSVFGVQFYPEGGPGSRESEFFSKFIKTMEDSKRCQEEKI